MKERTMKNTTKRLTAIALTAAMGLSSLAVTAQNAGGSIFGGNAVVAEAAEDDWFPDWFPYSNTFEVCRVNSYASMPSCAAKTALSQRLGEKITSSSGMYRNYRVVYTKKLSNAGYTDDIVLLYDAAKRPDLAAAANNGAVSAWLERCLQFINTERQMSGISNPHLIMILDAKKADGSYYSGGSYQGGNETGYDGGTSREIVDGIVGFSQTYMSWATLHECSHAYKNAAQSAFITSDEVFTNMRTICAVRALNRNSWMGFPDVLRPSSSGSLVRNGNRYMSSSVLQYACHDMKGDREDYFLPLSIRQIQQAHGGEGHKLFFARLGFIFELSTCISPFQSVILTDRAYADNLETDHYLDNYWDKAYALCISNVNNVTDPMMRRAKAKYSAYVKQQKYTIVVRTLDNWQPTTPQYVTPRVQSFIMNNYGKTGTAWNCSLGTLRAYNTYDFLFGDSNSTDFDNHMKGKAAGHSTITYFDVAEKIVGKYN